MDDAWHEYGSKLYPLLLHGNFLNETVDAHERFAGTLRAAAEAVGDEQLHRWLDGGAWREMLTSAWIIGLRQDAPFLPKLRERLITSRTSFAGQGLCFALARIGNSEAADALAAYLREYLPVGDREYDQEWAIGALAWIDDRLGTTCAKPFLDQAMWKVTAKDRVIGAKDSARGIDTMRRVMSFADNLDTSTAANQK